MSTLYSYVLRDLLKIFGMTLAGLTLLLTTGLSLINVLGVGSFTGHTALFIIPRLIPVTATLTMPIAALFAAALVYGRLAADNELTACRAAGINVHRLLWPAAWLSIFVVAFTLLFGNIFLPRIITQLEVFARENLRDLIAAQLRNKGYVHKPARKSDQAFTMTAQAVTPVSDESLRARGFEVAPDVSYLYVEAPTVLLADKDGKLLRFATARYGLCKFDRRVSPMLVSLIVGGGQDYQLGKDTVYFSQQQIGPVPFPLELPVRMSYMDLPTLLRWQKSPWQAEQIPQKLDIFLRLLTIERYYDEFAATINRDHRVTMRSSEGREYSVEAESARVSNDGHYVVLTNVKVSSPSGDPGRPQRYETQRAEIHAKPLPGSDYTVELRLVALPGAPLRDFNPRAEKYGTAIDKQTLSIDGLQLSGRAPEDVGQIEPRMVVDPAIRIASSASLADQRIGLQRDVRNELRHITATIHSRVGMVCSALLTTLMAAALGIVFRGRQVLAAIGLSCMPFLTVFLMMAIGRKIGNEVGALAGMIAIWGGLAVFALVDVAVIWRGVRR